MEKRPDLVHLTLGEFRFGGLDPTCVLSSDRFARAMLTPCGPGVLVIEPFGETLLKMSASGPGAGWLMDRAGDLLGMADEVPRFECVHSAVRTAGRRFGQVRLGRSFSPFQELLPAVLGQRITAREATRQWSLLVREFGDRAPGDHGLLLPPRPEVLAEVAYHRLHHLGIERSRAETLIRVAQWAASGAASRVLDCAEPSDATSSLKSIPGVGPWTAAVAGGLAFGDPDALPIGDFHIKNTVAWALAGLIRGTDEEMIELLSPYRGQRGRVVKWLQWGGWAAPRRGPRRRNVSIRTL